MHHLGGWIKRAGGIAGNFLRQAGSIAGTAAPLMNAISPMIGTAYPASIPFLFGLGATLNAFNSPIGTDLANSARNLGRMAMHMSGVNPKESGMTQLVEPSGRINRPKTHND